MEEVELDEEEEEDELEEAGGVVNEMRLPFLPPSFVSLTQFHFSSCECA